MPELKNHLSNKIFLIAIFSFIIWAGMVSHYSEITWIGESYIFSLFIFIIFIVVISYTVFVKKRISRLALNPLPWLTIVIFALLILTSIVKYDSTFETYRIVSPILLFILIPNIMESEKEWNIAIYLLLFAGLLWSTLSYIYFLENSGVLSSIWGYQNTFAAFLVLMIFLSLGLYLNAKDKNAKLALSFIPAFFIFLLYLTVSRGGYIVFFLSLILFFYTVKNRKKLTLETLPVFIEAAILIAVAAPPDITHTVFFKNKILVGYIGGHPNTSLAMRVYFAKLSTKIFLKRPITGFGLGSYRYMFTRFNRVDTFFRIDPHSLFFKLLSETGILGTGAFFTLVGYYFLKAFRNLKNKNTIYKGVFAGTVGLFIHMCMDVDVYPIMFIVLFVSLSLLSVDFNKTVKITKKQTYGIISALGIVAFIAIFSLYPKSIAAYYAMKGENVNFTTVKSAISILEKSVEIDPNSAAYRFELGKLYCISNHMDKAEEQFMKAYNINKLNYRFPLYAGMVELSTGELNKAKQNLSAAEKLYPLGRKVANYMAICTALNGNTIEAMTYIEKEKNIFKENPFLAEALLIHNKKDIAKELNRLKFYNSLFHKFNDIRRNYCDNFIQMKILENFMEN